MTYPEALARLLALRGGEHAGMRPGLERIEALCESLGHPERQLRLVQVGGTNGKGSIAAMLAAILQAAGRRTGLYTSPHLVSFRERIRVDGRAIPPDALVDGVESVATLAARLDASVFEATTALALDHFVREGVDTAVLEVGLGGRLDATTVGRPEAVVLGPIALDHQAVLGATLEAIAAEKAAIVRSGTAFSARQAPGVHAVLAERAAAARVPLLADGRELAVDVRAAGPAREVAELTAREAPALTTHQTLDCRGPDWRFEGLELALPGGYQPANALLAVAAAHSLGCREADVRAGLAAVRWPGRFELRTGDRLDGLAGRRLGGRPVLVLDGAHNPAGAAALADALRARFGGARLHLVLGVSTDKDARGILAALVPLCRRAVLTRARHDRAADPLELRDIAVSVAPQGAPQELAVAPDVEAALAGALAPPDPGVVCVAGSLYLVGEALRALGEPGDDPRPLAVPVGSMERTAK